MSAIYIRWIENDRISITGTAFEAIKATPPFGSVAYEPKVNDQGEREI
jgi:hypothetical protein